MRRTVMVLLAVACAGCQPGFWQLEPPRPSNAEDMAYIIIERHELEASAEARTADTAKYLSSGAVGLATAVAGGNPLGVMAAYGLSLVGLEAVSQGKQGQHYVQRVYVPVWAYAGASVEYHRDGSVVVKAGRPDDGGVSVVPQEMKPPVVLGKE